MKRLGGLTIIGISFLIGGIMAVAAWRIYMPPPGESEPLASSGGARLEIPPYAEGHHYVQSDPRWASDIIGGSGEPLSAVGCTICSVATAASHLGYDISPRELNLRLIQSLGFTRHGWLIWGKIAQVTEGAVSVRVPSGWSHPDLDAALPVREYPGGQSFPARQGATLGADRGQGRVRVSCEGSAGCPERNHGSVG